MSSPTFILWDVGYPLYTYGSLFIIALFIWHIKRNHQGLRLGANKSCYKCYRRVKQRPRDRTPRGKSQTSKEEAEKLQKLLSIMKRQGWLPQEGSVRRLLCSEPSCSICNAMAMEIQQLLGIENKMASPVSLRASQSFPSLEALPPSKAELDKSPELCSQHSRDVSQASSLTPSQSTDQKSSTQSAAPSTGDSNMQYYCPDPPQKQEPQGSSVSRDAGSLSSSSVEEPGVPANQQKRRKRTKKFVLKDQAPPEADAENKMTFFSHWVNPEVKCNRLEEPFVLSKTETEAKPKIKEPEKSQTPVRANAEKTAKDPKAKPLGAKKNI
ncbi:protein FAM205C isoform X1 [Peromyscus californicus insignis]|uniref:protein FAM205C isoform X1 n=2 Tax=Peromyscus californicus insignis TaxID=564181 RepID=UPI0022A72576|nr:protein FAM205C isoform X1 [Peromyscus californicus insignis]